jgi:hypothetical protein
LKAPRRENLLHDMKGARFARRRRPLRAVGVSQQLGDEFASRPAAGFGDPLEPRRVLAWTPAEHAQPRRRIAVVKLERARVEQGELGVEIAALRIGICPGSLAMLYLPRALRCAKVALQPDGLRHARWAGR